MSAVIYVISLLGLPSVLIGAKFYADSMSGCGQVGGGGVEPQTPLSDCHCVECGLSCLLSVLKPCVVLFFPELYSA